jgi:hypothetical protein
MANFCGNINPITNQISMPFSANSNVNLTSSSINKTMNNNINNQNIISPKNNNSSNNLNIINNSNPIILVAKFDYASKEEQELDLKKNERLILIDNSKKWWLVRKMDTDQTG